MGLRSRGKTDTTSHKTIILGVTIPIIVSTTTTTISIPTIERNGIVVVHREHGPAECATRLNNQAEPEHVQILLCYSVILILDDLVMIIWGDEFLSGIGVPEVFQVPPLFIFVVQIMYT